MSKTVVIHQPDFLPYLGFFDRLLKCDFFVILDNVNFVSGTSKSWTNRDKIKTPRGEEWLTISVKKHKKGTLIKDIELSESVDWRSKNLNLLQQNYKSAPCFDEIHPVIEQLYTYKSELLIDFNMQSINLLCELFNIKTEMAYASDLNCEGTNNELLVDILKKVKADVYLSGLGAKDYFNPDTFDTAGIKVVWQKFIHPVYSQLYDNFIPSLSSIDILYNCGIEKSCKYLRGEL